MVNKNNKDIIHIQIYGSHAKLLLDKKEVMKVHPNIVFQTKYNSEFNYEVNTVDPRSDKYKLYTPVPYAKKLDKNIVTWDCEHFVKLIKYIHIWFHYTQMDNIEE